MTDLALLQIDEAASIAAAFRRLNENRAGILAVIDAERRVLGVVTDGDIRRHLLSRPDTAQPIASCANRAFVRLANGAPREAVLKLLDQRIRAIPLLDAAGRLAGIVTRESFRLEAEARVYARARAPVRISFGGGGTDLTRYFIEHGGVVMNATVSLFTHATLRRREDRCAAIRSADFAQSVEADSPAALPFDGRLDLVKAVVRLIEPDYGFELEIGSDFPPGSGLGGSAVVAAAVIGCFNQFREDRWDRHQIAEMAFQAERLLLGIPGGWQDQYATVFGGFNYMEFTAEHNTIYPLRLDGEVTRELEASLLLCDTGLSHASGELQAKTLAAAEDEGAARRFAQESKALTLEMKRLLLRGRLLDYGRLMNETWRVKREFLPHTTTPELDRLYEVALSAGAVGGRLLGAGAGGHFLFFTEPFRRFELLGRLREEGLEPRSFTFDDQGLQSWTARSGESAAGEGLG
ncbi:MAG: CBS domain-containing protein [Kiloniellales bacterium]